MNNEQLAYKVAKKSRQSGVPASAPAITKVLDAITQSSVGWYFERKNILKLCQLCELQCGTSLHILKRFGVLEFAGQGRYKIKNDICFFNN